MRPPKTVAPLDYDFWDTLANYTVLLGSTEPFANLEELKQKIIAVSNDARLSCTTEST